MIDTLLNALRQAYGRDFHDLQLLRDWIGKVYAVTDDARQRYILKLFRGRQADSALMSAMVMRHLYEKGAGVPQVVPACDGALSFEHEGHVCVLYEFINGAEVERDGKLTELGAYAAKMTDAMRDYAGELPVHGREFFVDRYLDIMLRRDYPRAYEFQDIGQALWDSVRGLPAAFCHGDFHCGNMFLRNGDIIAYDFDACAKASPVYDVAAMCDSTDYFSLKSDNFTRGFIRTRKNVDLFMQGHGGLSQAEIDSVPAFIAIRHFDIQATIIEARGDGCVGFDFLDRQLEWLRLWLNAAL